MSDQLKSFDQLFREKLGNHAVKPPEAVWDNIVEQRSFGHIITQKISNYWRGLSILLLLLLMQGNNPLTKPDAKDSFILQDKISEKLQESKTETVQNNDSIANNLISEEALELSKLTKTNKRPSENFASMKEVQHVPDADLIASLGQAAFSRPEISDPILNSYIKHLEGWETAKPISFVRYDHLSEIPLRRVYRQESKKFPLEAGHIDYDYVVSNNLMKKPFRERLSVVFAFSPQHIKKSMKADFNLSSAYLKDRLKTENFRMAYTASALVHYELKKSAFLQSGLNFTQIYEEMHYENEKRFSNQYNFFEVPLYYGYEARNAKWGWMIKGGIGVQVFNSYQGYILKKTADKSLPAGTNPINPQYRMRSSDAFKSMIAGNHTLSPNQDRRGVLDLENTAENPYKKGGVINFHIAGGLTYYHSIKTSFILSPHYSRSINSITDKDAKFTENIHYYGLSIGSRIKF